MKTAATLLLATIALVLPVYYVMNVDRWVGTQLLVASRPAALVSLPVGPLKAVPLVMTNQQYDRPKITNVSRIGPEHDLCEYLICDAASHSVGLMRAGSASPDVKWLVPPNSVTSPCHAVFTDYDNDGDLDVAVAALGQVWPTDSRCGQVVMLVNDGEDHYDVQVLMDDLRRVTDVQPADFDSDGDIDFVVAEFGYLHGGIVYLERQTDGSYRRVRLLDVPGTIHVPVADYDNDGDVEFAAVVSQDFEEVILFDNPGGDTFQPQQTRVWRSTNFDLGMAGMVPDDLDQDGDIDLVLSAGDNLELDFPYPQTWHGCFWLENTGENRFAEHSIGNLPGTYGTAVSDLDGDGDRDVVVVSMFNDWNFPGATSLGWMENDGHQNFTAWHLASTPTHLCTVATGDITGDGIPEIVAGALQIYPPYEQEAQGVTVWSVRKAEP